MNESLREKRESEAIFEEIMAENFPELMKGMSPQIRRAQHMSNKLSKRNPHLVKCVETALTPKTKILKAPV